MTCRTPWRSRSRPGLHVRGVRRPRGPPRGRPGGGRGRAGRQGRVLPVQRRAVPGDGVRRLQARRGASQRQLPLHQGRADRAARRRRRRRAGVQRRPRGQRGARRSALPSLRLLVRVGPAPDIAPGDGLPGEGGARRSGRARARRPVRRDRAAPQGAAPGRRPALHVHRRHHGQAEGRHLAHVPAASARCGLGLFSRLGVAEPPATVDDLVAIVRSVRASGQVPGGAVRPCP